MGPSLLFLLRALLRALLRGRTCGHAPCGGERGQVTVLAALALGCLLLLTLALVALGQRMVQRAEAQKTADVVALAAASHGADAAFRVAEANGSGPGTVRIHTTDQFVRVDVQRGTTGAAAQAKKATVQPAGLIPAVAAAVARASQLMGEPIRISSGWRSRADQEALWAARHTNPYPVAVPGTSQHEAGRAIDVDRTQVAALLAVASQVGLCQPLPVADPIHFIWCAD